MENINIELLAPAGNYDSLKCAVNNKTNAVYLGLNNFNARNKAENFNKENIAEAVAFCHLHNVKVYMTVNTLVNNSEIPEFMETIKLCVQEKVDAFIIQDLGMATMLLQSFDNIVLHASTQLGVHNLYGAKVLEKIGFKRVILARETKLKDIIEIKKHTNLEIEYFVQGALCVSFSGNCYLSYYKTGNSGNRGMCNQLCRMKYSCEDKEGYLLSTRDLCLINNLKTLIDAGVCSFKIEGRLKRVGYVAVATNTYREALDKIINNKKFDSNKSIKNLTQVFSRGEFNQKGYLFDNKNTLVNQQKHNCFCSSSVTSQTRENNPEQALNQNSNNQTLNQTNQNHETISNNLNLTDIINPISQNHVGVKIGKVLKIKPFKDLYIITIYSTKELHKNDGLKFYNIEMKEIASLGIGNINILGDNKYEIFTKHKPQIDNIVYLTLDKELEDNLIANKNPVICNMEIEALQNNFLKCKIYNNFASVDYISENICAPAKTTPLTKADIITQFSKTNNEDIVVNKIDVNLDNVFIAKSELNNNRRQALQLFINKLIINFEINNIAAFNNTKYNKFILDNNLSAIYSSTENKIIDNTLKNNNVSNQLSNSTLSTINQIIVVDEFFEIKKLNKFDKLKTLITLSPSKYSLETITTFSSNIKKFGFVNYALFLPIIANYNDLQIIDGILDNDNNIVLIANNLYGLYYKLKDRVVIGGLGLNIYNNLTAKFLSKFGIDLYVMSIEQSNDSFCLENNTFKFIFGNFTLMTFCHCPNQLIKGQSCANCSSSTSLTYIDEFSYKYNIKKYLISNCYFELNTTEPINRISEHNNNSYIDLRNLNTFDLTKAINIKK